MLVRDALEKDAAAIALVQVTSYRTAYDGLMPAGYLAAFSVEEQAQDWKDLIERNNEILLVAENEVGDIVGYALSKQTPESTLNDECELVALHILPGYHRRGYGRSLIRATARIMHAKGCRSLGLWVLDGNPACRFYERLGGKRNGEHFFEIEEFNVRRREIGYQWEKIEELFE